MVANACDSGAGDGKAFNREGRREKPQSSQREATLAELPSDLRVTIVCFTLTVLFYSLCLFAEKKLLGFAISRCIGICYQRSTRSPQLVHVYSFH